MAMLMMVRRLRVGLTVHGFRSTFRDWISEKTEHSPEVAEMALAHTIGNKVEQAYRRGNLLERRKRLHAGLGILLPWQFLVECSSFTKTESRLKFIHHAIVRRGENKLPALAGRDFIAGLVGNKHDKKIK